MAEAPEASAVEITPLEGAKRSVSVIHDGHGECGLHMTHALGDVDHVGFNDYHPFHGRLFRSVAYLNAEQRRALAAELLRGLDG